MKYKWLFIVLPFLIQNMYAQILRDTVFNEVILINKDNITTNGHDYLIDIPIKVQQNPIVIYNDDFRIPSKLFFERKSFLYEQNKIILITPDWEYYKSVYERDKKYGTHSEPLRQCKIYHMNRIFERIDSITINPDDRNIPIKINFKKTQLKNEIKYYFSDCYGSKCCPRDKKWDFLEEVHNSIKLFENKKGVNISKDIYCRNLGEEGEHCDYYPLSSLTNEQKLMFINEMKSTQFAQIHTPWLQDWMPTYWRQ